MNDRTITGKVTSKITRIYAMGRDLPRRKR